MKLKPFPFFILLLSTFFACTPQEEKKEEIDENSISKKDTIKPKPNYKDTISIIGVGDLVPGSNYPNESHLPPNDGKNLMSQVYHILRTADITFGTFESNILDDGGVLKYCQNPAVCFAFRLPDKYAKIFADAGFDAISLANNHINDFGRVAIDNTHKVIKDLGIKVTGLLESPTAIIEREGLRIGIASFGPYHIIMPDMRDLVLVRKTIQDLKEKEKCDIVIVTGSGGSEGAAYQHVPRRTEVFYGENRGNVYEFSHTAIDAGADLVLQNGPHVMRGVELYKNRFIAYSLGNFCTPKLGIAGLGGIAPIMDVKMNRKGEFLYAQITPTTQQNGSVVSIDPEKRAIKIIRNLSKQDFPESPLEIREDGKIVKIKS